MTLKQAERQLLKASSRHSDWHESVGFHFRLFQLPADYDCSNLPPEFELLFHTPEGDCVVRELLDDYPDYH